MIWNWAKSKIYFKIPDPLISNNITIQKISNNAYHDADAFSIPQAVLDHLYLKISLFVNFMVRILFHKSKGVHTTDCLVILNFK